MELIVCVSTAEALRAAVVAGVDAVRIGLKDFSAAGLPLEELKKAVTWCRVRGVRISAGMEQPPSGKRFRLTLQSPLYSHQLPQSEYHPESMTRY